MTNKNPSKVRRLAQYLLGSFGYAVVAIGLFIVILIVAGTGYYYYFEWRHEPYANDDEYRFECPMAPDKFTFRTSDRDVRLKMGEHVFTYPYGYSIGLGYPKKKPNGRVFDRMYILYPEMVPASSAEIEQWRIGVNQVYIDIAYFPDGKRHFELPSALKSPDRIGEPKRIEKLGLIGIRDTLFSNKVVKYVPIDSSFNAVPGHSYELESIGLNMYPRPPDGMAVVVFPLREKIWIRYRIFSHYLPCWRQIHDAVYRLTNSFVQGEQ